MPLPALPGLVPRPQAGPSEFATGGEHYTDFEQNTAKLQRELASMFFRDFPSTAPKYVGSLFFSFHIIAGIIAMSYSATLRNRYIKGWWKIADGDERYEAKGCLGVSGAQANSAFCTPAPAPGIFGSAGHPMLGSTVAFLALLMILYGYSLPWVQ